MVSIGRQWKHRDVNWFFLKKPQQVSGGTWVFIGFGNFQQQAGYYKAILMSFSSVLPECQGKCLPQEKQLWTAGWMDTHEDDLGKLVISLLLCLWYEGEAFHMLSKCLSTGVYPQFIIWNYLEVEKSSFTGCIPRGSIIFQENKWGDRERFSMGNWVQISRTWERFWAWPCVHTPLTLRYWDGGKKEEETGNDLPGSMFSERPVLRE